MSLNATVARVTDRIKDRSGPVRSVYLDRMVGPEIIKSEQESV